MNGIIKRALFTFPLTIATAFCVDYYSSPSDQQPTKVNVSSTAIENPAEKTDPVSGYTRVMDELFEQRERCWDRLLDSAEKLDKCNIQLANPQNNPQLQQLETRLNACQTDLKQYQQYSDACQRDYLDLVDICGKK